MSTKTISALLCAFAPVTAVAGSFFHVEPVSSGWVTGVGIGHNSLRPRGEFGTVEGGDGITAVGYVGVRLNRYLDARVSYQNFSSVLGTVPGAPVPTNIEYSSEGYGASLVARTWPDRRLRLTALVGAVYHREELRFTEYHGYITQPVEHCEMVSGMKHCTTVPGTAPDIRKREDNQQVWGLDAGIGVEWAVTPRAILTFNVARATLNGKFFDGATPIDCNVKRWWLGGFWTY